MSTILPMNITFSNNGLRLLELEHTLPARQKLGSGGQVAARTTEATSEATSISFRIGQYGWYLE